MQGNLLILHVYSRQLHAQLHPYALCVLGGCVDAAEGCGHICIPEKKRMCVSLCMGGKNNPQSSHFCLMKNGRLAFRDVFSVVY